jgi:glutamate transport system substrate-binding protein
MRQLTSLLALTLALGLVACGDDEEEAPAPVEDEAASQFEPDTMMDRIAERGTIQIGVKKDQPGIGFQEPGADSPRGFDIQMAEIVAAKLGIEPDGIEWVETVSKNREPFLQNGTVDLVLASYSITDERQEVVGQAGPYYVTGQQRLDLDQDGVRGVRSRAGAVRHLQRVRPAALERPGRRGHDRRRDPARLRGSAA